MYKAPRGTIDILPVEQGYYRYVEEKAAETCRCYGYGRIDTPVFEDAHLFVRTIGQGTDIVEKETYTFDDRSGQEMTLRPEGTAPVCRAYIEHGMGSLQQPVKLYYFASIFRYERPQKGRYRQHHQFGVEAIGEAAPSLDVEMIEMAWVFYKELGLKKLTLYINSIGCKSCRPAYIDNLKKYYSEHIDNLCPQCKIRFKRNPLRLLDCKESVCQTVANAAPKSEKYLCHDCKEHFKIVSRNLRLLKVPYKKNHRLVRGLDYYTRTVFEIQPKSDSGSQSALGGGGRYDDLIKELGGKPTPAIGFAVGIDRIVINLKEQKIEPPPPEDMGIYIAYTGEKARAAAFKLAAEMRRAGIPVHISYGAKSLKAQMRQANNIGVSFAFIFGDDEVENGTVTYRDMAEGEQWEVEVDEVLSLLTQG
ncbi:MAG: histidine--tRNA ligase [Chloroflexota bacterium]|nr:histidine--tRNA ligase [Chloroflexota bacterium]